jgi:hypothetical protein
MIVSKHAIVQYKRRFGKRTTSGHKIIRHIKNQINEHQLYSYRNAIGTIDIITEEFRAVIDSGRVVTITKKSAREEEQTA